MPRILPKQKLQMGWFTSEPGSNGDEISGWLPDGADILDQF